MIRLLMGITLSEAGGSQRVVYGILSGLPEDLYDVTLVTAPGGELLDWVAELNRTRSNKVKAVALPCLKRDLSPFHDAVAFLRLFVLQARSRFDVAHFHNSKMGILGRLSARLAGVPGVYYTVHGWGLNRNTTGRLFGLMSLIEKIAAGLSTEIVFVSRSDMEEGVRRGWAKASSSRLIRNGAAEEPEGKARIRESLGIGGGMPVIAFVARLAEPKDPLFAIRVSRLLAEHGVEHRLLVVGDGPLRAECARLAAEPGAGAPVMLLGLRGDVSTILRETDIFCLFTKWEGLPVSILEAMLAGLPVVASAVGGVPELVRHGETGYLLEGFDAERAADYLAKLIGDRELRLAMGRAGRSLALAGFTLEGMVEGYRRLYEEHVTKPETGRAAWPRQYSQED